LSLHFSYSNLHEREHPENQIKIQATGRTLFLNPQEGCSYAAKTYTKVIHFKKEIDELNPWRFGISKQYKSHSTHCT
jgi:hypothetical protein